MLPHCKGWQLPVKYHHLYCLCLHSKCINKWFYSALHMDYRSLPSCYSVLLAFCLHMKCSSNDISQKSNRWRSITLFADGGHGGLFVYHTGRQMSIMIANGTHYWLLEKNLPNTIQSGDWFNLAFRWRPDKGIQVHNA